jgi:hypothetical protein
LLLLFNLPRIIVHQPAAAKNPEKSPEELLIDREIAAVLGKSPKATDNALQRVKAKVKKALEGGYD